MKKLDYFLTYAFRRKKYIAAALLLLLGDVAVTSVMPLLMSRVVDQGVLTGSIETVKSVTLVMALAHTMQDIPAPEVPKFIEALIEMFESDHRDLCERIDREGQLPDDLKQEILDISAKFKEKYRAA